MTKHHMSTYVTVPEKDGPVKLRALAIERLGGSDGVKLVSQSLSNGNLCGTFTIDWADPEPPLIELETQE
jgi:hypothetical protein